jgi:hypothetical protein
MACGDARNATMFARWGLTIVVDPSRREFTSAHRLTAAGVEWVTRHLKDVVIVEEPDD